MKLIDKDALVVEIERLFKKAEKSSGEYQNGAIHTLITLKDKLDTIETKEVDLEKTKWSPSKKQIESLGALVRYNIGVFDYQKLNEVAILYDDLTKILDYETDRQK